MKKILRRLGPFAAFTIFWLLFANMNGLTDHLHELPRGVHQSAQCDRASLAQNFFYGNLNILYPEVNEDRCMDGIVSCEFPFVSWLAALFYRLFGYDEFWFRLLSFVLYSTGMFMVWNLFRTRMHALTAGILVLLLQSSPVLLFYGPGFLPDIASLGLSFCAWYLFFGLFIQHAWIPPLKGNIPVVLFVMVTGLAMAVKTTSVIQWLTMASLATVLMLRHKKFRTLSGRNGFLILGAALILPAVWYFWSRHLASTHNSQYFMMRVPLSETWQSYSDAWAVYLANWPPQALSDPLIYIACSLMIVTVFLKRFIQFELWLISSVNSLGSIAFLFLMIEQFKYHDYYMICLFPAFVLNWLALADALRKRGGYMAYVKIALFVLLAVALNYQFHRGRINLEERYTEGNYWEQSHHRATDLDTFRMMLRKAGVNRNDCSVTGYDSSPNDMLYLLHLRGHRFSKEHDDERLNHILQGSKPKWLISNDTDLSRRIAALVPARKILAYKSLELYALDHSTRSR